MASTTKQLHRLLKTIDNFSNGQASVDTEKLDFDEEIENFEVVIAPTGGPYRGGKFRFCIVVDEGFPDYAPRVECLTPIYHPNIDSDGTLCFNLVEDEWREDLTLEDVVQGLLFLFYSPNVGDPLSAYFSGMESWDEFKENVRKVLRGGHHFDTDFPRNLDSAYEDDECEDVEQPKINDDDSDVTSLRPDLTDIEDVLAATDESEVSLEGCVSDLHGERDELTNGRNDRSFLKNVGRRLAFVLRTAVQLFGKYG